MKQKQLRDSQVIIVGLFAYISDAITKISFGLFIPDWGTAVARRFERNNQQLEQREK